VLPSEAAIAVVEAALIAFEPFTIPAVAFPSAPLPALALEAIAIVSAHPVARHPSMLDAD
jgi:hypothetical protein